MRVLNFILVAGLLHVTSGDEEQTKPQLSLKRSDRQADSIKYLLTLNRQKYLQKFQQKPSSNSISTTSTIDRQSVQQLRSQRIQTSSEQQRAPQRVLPNVQPRVQPNVQQANIDARKESSQTSFLERARSRYQERLEKIRESRLKLQESRSSSPQPQRSFSSNTFKSNDRFNDRSRFRQTIDNKPFRPSSPFTRPHHSSNCDCEDLRKENEMLKDVIVRLEGEMIRSGGGNKQSKDGLAGLINLINREDTDDKTFRNSGDINYQESNKNSRNEEILSSFLSANELEVEPVQPSFTTTTVLHTNVFETSIVEDVTREIALIFKGKRITTEIIEEETKFVPTSSVVTQTIRVQVTPTIPAPVVPTGLPGLLTGLPGLQTGLPGLQTGLPVLPVNGLPTKLPNVVPSLPNKLAGLANLIQPTPSLLPNPSTKNTLDSFQALQSILLKIKQAREAIKKSSASLSLAVPSTTILTSSAPVLTSSAPTIEITPTSVYHISDNKPSTFNIYSTPLLPSVVTSTTKISSSKVEPTYTQLTSKTGPVYVQLSRVESSTILPSKVDLTSAYQISSEKQVMDQKELKQDALIESDKQSESASASVKVNDGATKDNTNNHATYESNQNSDSFNNIDISPVFPSSVIKSEVETSDNTNSYNVNSDDNNSSDNDSNAIEDNSEGYVIIGESVSSSSSSSSSSSRISSQEDSQLNIQPVFPQIVSSLQPASVVTPAKEDKVDVESSVHVIVATLT